MTSKLYIILSSSLFGLVICTFIPFASEIAIEFIVSPFIASSLYTALIKYEALSINDQRIVPTTGISCGGNIIDINGEKVGVPFVIKAIGLTEKLNGALTMPGGYLELLENDGVQVKVEETSNIVIPKYNGIYNFQYAENVE